MASNNESGGTLAILIDADNANPAIVRGLIDEVAKLGRATVRRIYGDWTAPNLASWKKVLLEYSIQPIQQFAYTSGKNASDITLVIDAMDLLHSGRFDGFCLVSSDSDFTRLASRIREDVKVYGFGKRTTPESFRQACDRFVFTDILGAGAVEAAAQAEPAEPLAPVDRIAAMLREIIQTSDDGGGWANLGAVGSVLNRQMPDFDPRSYGAKKLLDLVRSLPGFEVEAAPGGPVRVRLKSKPAGKRAARASSAR